MTADASQLVQSAIETARNAGASQVDAVLIRADSHEARVRAEEIDFVKQSQDRCLGLRAMVLAGDGLSTAITSTSDLAPESVEKLAHETVALARATAPDPHAGLPEGDFAEDLPDLDLIDPGDRCLRSVPCVAGRPLKPQRFIPPAKPLPLLVLVTSTYLTCSKTPTSIVCPSSSWLLPPALSRDSR